jgi:pSer/pThr/pTyr-binding forkhead associated (FHA) protein
LADAGIRDGDTLVVVAPLRVSGTATEDRPRGHVELPDGSAISFKTGRDLRMGRGPDNEVILSDDSVSRNHAVLKVGAEGEAVVEDLGSKNGVLVNGNAVNRQLLRSGDLILLGDVTLTVVLHPDVVCPRCAP